MRNARKHLWNVIRVAVTLGAIAYVLTQITWRDRLRLASGEEVWGRRTRTSDGAAVLVALDGVRHPIPPEPADPSVASPFIPGFLTLLAGVDLRGFLLVLGAYVVTIVLMARRWQWLLQTHDLDPGFLEALRLTWVGLLANNVLPGATGGDLLKGWCIYRRSPHKRMAAVITVLMDRVLGLVSLMIVGAVAMLAQAGQAELGGPLRFVVWVLLMILAAGLVFFSGRIRRLLRVSEIAARLPFYPQIHQVDQSIFHYRRHAWVLVRCVLISMVVHLWTIGCIYFLGRSLGLRVALINYYIFLPVIFTAGAVLPSIAGLGVLEGLFQQFFSRVGATPSSAVALCVLYRIMTILASLLGAAPMYRELSRRGVNSLEPRAANPVPEPLQPAVSEV